MSLLESLSIFSHFELIFLEESSVVNLLNSVFFWEARRTCDLKATQYKTFGLVNLLSLYENWIYSPTLLIYRCLIQVITDKSFVLCGF